VTGRGGSGPSGGAADRPWWSDAVVYQIYPRSFADSDGDGIGDLRGITAHLDHLSALGVDVLWLSPVYRSPQADNGYDVSDYQDVDPVFGTLADLDDLLDQVHARGLRLVMDLVVNHTSDEHAWFVDSRSAADSARRDWYIWRPPRPGTVGGTPGAEPNNWGSAFGGPAWTFDPSTGEYYLHLFTPKQPDLNWANPQVRSAVHAMMTWWLDRGVDGFRMDVINFIDKAVDLPDGSAVPGSRFGDGGPHYVNGPRLHGYLREMNERVFARSPRPCLAVGETPGVGVADAVLFTDPARHELDMVFQFEHAELDRGRQRWVHRPLDLRDLKESLGRWQRGLAETGWNSLYLSNHDQARLVSRYGDDLRFRYESATALATVLHLHRGTPYVYQGEELGMTNYPFGGIDDFQDVEAVELFREATEVQGVDPQEVLAGLRLLSRDNARTPMQWDATAHAGFSTGTPWLAVNPNHTEVNAAAQVGVPGSVFDYYRRLIALRHTEPTVAVGDFTMLLPQDTRIYALLRTLGATGVLAIANLSGETVIVPDLPERSRWAGAEVVLRNYHRAPDGPGAAADGDALRSLGPWEARVLRRRDGR